MSFRHAVAAGAATFAFATVPLSAAQPVSWTPDLVHSRAEFTVSHLIVSKVWGHIPIRALVLESARGSIVPEKIEATLDVSHEDTDDHTRDADLRSSTYFDVEKYPTLRFQSTRIVPKGAQDFDVTGDLTIKDVTKSITFPVHVEGRVPDPQGTRVGYSGTLHLDRRDFGIVDQRLNAAGVLLVGYDVAIGLTVEAVTPDASVRGNS